MPDHIKSILLVSLQFLFIGILVMGSSLQNINSAATIVILLSILLVFWAITAMQKSKLRILPEPSSDATLITNGPYRFIRHPMYTAILLGCIGLLLNFFSMIRLVIFLALATILIIKLTWEETMLIQKFDAYKSYRNRTSRLIPFLF